MTNTIQHEGVIREIGDSVIRVNIIQATACSSCSAKGYCSSSESKEKFIDIPYPNAQSTNYKVGDTVFVVGETSMGLKAVLLAFVLPFIAIIAFLFLFMRIFDNELYAAVLALLSLVPYYFILWLSKNYIKDKFTFKIKPIK